MERHRNAEPRRVWIDSFPQRIPLCLVHKILNMRPCHPVAEIFQRESQTFFISKDGGDPPIGEIKITEIGRELTTYIGPNTVHHKNYKGCGFFVVEYKSLQLFELMMQRGVYLLALKTRKVLVHVFS